MLESISKRSKHQEGITEHRTAASEERTRPGRVGLGWVSSRCFVLLFGVRFASIVSLVSLFKLASRSSSYILKHIIPQISLVRIWGAADQYALLLASRWPEYRPDRICAGGNACWVKFRLTHNQSDLTSRPTFARSSTWSRYAIALLPRNRKQRRKEEKSERNWNPSLLSSHESPLLFSSLLYFFILLLF